MRTASRLLALAWGVGIAASAGAQSFTQQPLLQSHRTDELWLQWETDSDPPATVHAVDWGEASVLEHSTTALETIQVDANHFLHRAKLTGLQADTAYLYRVRSGPAISPVFSTSTAPASGGGFRMGWLSDNQDQAGTSFQGVLEALVPHAVDFIGHTGDTVQNGTVVQEWHDDWSTPLTAASNLGQSTPVLVARGNHDGESATAYAYHWLDGNGAYYAYTVDRVRFVVLDGNLRIAAQTAWLDVELASPAAQDAEFLVVYLHTTPYTNLWCNASGYNGEPYVRTHWVPLFEQHGVDLVVAGHAHAYERGTRNGVVYTVVGGAGGHLDTIVPPSTWPFIEVALPVHHFVVMDVAESRLEWTAWDLAGNVIDHFSLPPPAVPARPAWAAAALAGALLGGGRGRRSARNGLWQSRLAGR